MAIFLHFEFLKFEIFGSQLIIVGFFDIVQNLMKIRQLLPRYGQKQPEST